MSDEDRPTLEQQFRQEMERLERAVIGACDRAVRTCPPRRPLKHALFGTVRQALVENHRDIAAAAVGNPALTLGERHRINDFNAAVYLYMYALCGLAMDGNTQWDEPEILVDQFKHRLRRAIRESRALVAETGQPLNTASDDVPE